MSANVGKVRLKQLSELLENNTNTNDENAVNKTPEKIKKAGNVRAATTARKRTKAEPDQIIVSRTVTKRSAKKEPPQGQMRIDSFFKSSSKNFKIDVPPPSPEVTKGSSARKKTPRKNGRKRLFHEATTSTTTTTESELEVKLSRKRTQPPRKVKQNEDCDVIDLCSDDDTEVKPLKLCESPKSELAVLMEQQSPPLASINAPAPMVRIPLQSLPDAAADEASSKENKSKGRAPRKPRPCPPYKVVEGTSFAVDGFQYGDIPNVSHYFLTHFHADHYVGLTRKFSHPLYMSPTTARLVRAFIPIEEKYLHEIEIDEPIMINNVEITAIDANHCPGAIMLFFKLSSGKCILHTGDFRASYEMESLPIFWNHPKLDLLYLDTTYLSQKYDFCHQTESIDRTIELVRAFREKNISKRILYVCGSYVIGKEKIWMTLAKEFDLKVWTEPHRRQAVKCLELPDMQELLCDDANEANLHIISLGHISYPRLVEYFKPFAWQYDMLLGIRPSGWEKNSKPSYGKVISVIGVEYSEHSSYKELERFVRFTKPKFVISTVPVARDLFVTASVPQKWYQYEGYGSMLSNGYQPSISTFLTMPRRPLPTPQPNSKNEMAISPLEGISNHDVENDSVESAQSIISSARDTDDNDTICRNPVAGTPDDTDAESVIFAIKECKPKVSDAAVAPSRFTSDASDDWLS